MSYIFFSDPHIGKTLSSHTTPTSRKKLKEDIVSMVDSIFSAEPEANGFICGGDLFDKYSNKEEDLAAAYSVLKKLKVCVAGNHDLIADREDLSSVELLSSILQAEGEDPVITSPSLIMLEDDRGDLTTALHVIPHVYNQTAFQEQIEKLTTKRNCLNVVLLHCNYDSEFATDETTLNLSKAAAAWLLEEKGFDYILIGHEHAPATHHGGRLIVMGNTQPTSFHDISDKFYWKLEKGKFTKKQIYSAEDKYLKVKAEDFLSETFILPEGTEWVRVVGDVSPENSVALLRKVKSLWAGSDSLIAVKVDSVVAVAGTNNPQAERSDLTQVLGKIGSELKKEDSAVYYLWLEIEAEILREKEND